MQNQVLVVVLKEEMSAAEIIEAMKRIKDVEGVVVVKTFERIVEDALPVPSTSEER